MTRGIIFFSVLVGAVNAIRACQRICGWFGRGVPLQDDPLQQTTQQKTFSMEEVQKHNRGNDCWVVIRQNVYNLSGFYHPGGSDQIKCGSDVTDKFLRQHPGSHQYRLRHRFLGTVAAPLTLPAEPAGSPAPTS